MTRVGLSRSWRARAPITAGGLRLSAVVLLLVASAQPQQGGFDAGNGYLGDSSDQAFAKLDEATYNAMLRRRHFDLTRDQLITLAEQEYQRIEAEMVPLAKQIDPSKSWHEILRNFEQSHHPQTLAEVIPAYQRELAQAKSFVEKNGLITIPPARELPVVETPKAWAGTYAYALYRFREDVLMVTLEVPNGSEAEALRSHNDGLIAVAAVHEAYPGHRVQTLISSTYSVDPELEAVSEGWGLYCEELMLRAGYYDNGPPERKLFALRMLLWRAARALLDGKLHRGDITPEQAAKFLSENIGLSEDRAHIEVQARYIELPASVATYLVGKRQIEQLRHQVEVAEGTHFSLKSFHDRLLSQGLKPVQTLARENFHMELDSSGIVHAESFARQKPGAEPARVNGGRWWWLVLPAVAVVSFAAYRSRVRAAAYAKAYNPPDAVGGRR